MTPEGTITVSYTITIVPGNLESDPLNTVEAREEYLMTNIMDQIAANQSPNFLDEGITLEGTVVSSITGTHNV